MLPECLLYLTFIFSILAFACAEPWSVAILQVIISTLFAVGTWRNTITFSRGPGHWLITAIMTILLVGALQLTHQHPITHPNVSMFFTTSGWATRKALLLWSSYALLLLAVPPVLENPTRLKRLCWLIFGLCVFTAAAGLGIRSERSTLLMGFRELGHPGVHPFGPFVNRDHAASFLAMGGLMGWGLFFSKTANLQTARSRTTFFDSMAIALLALVMVGAIAFCLVLTGSRGGTHSFFLTSFFMGFLAASLFTEGRTRLGSYAILACASGIYLYLLQRFPMWRGYVDGSWIDALQWRVSMYRSGLSMLGDIPLTGAGLGSFMHGFPIYQEAMVTGVVEHIHGDWLESVLQVGVLGFSPLAVAWISILLVGLRNWVHCPSHELRALCGGALGGIIAISIHMLLEAPLQIPANAITVLLLVCVTGTRSIVVGKCSGKASTMPNRLTISRQILVGIVTIAMTAASLPPIIAEVYFYRARYAPDHSKAYFLSQAIYWDPNPKYAAQLGQIYADLADKSPMARITLWRAALNSTTAFERKYPLHYRLLRVREFAAYCLERTTGQ